MSETNTQKTIAQQKEETEKIIRDGQSDCNKAKKVQRALKDLMEGKGTIEDRLEIVEKHRKIDDEVLFRFMLIVCELEQKVDLLWKNLKD